MAPEVHIVPGARGCDLAVRLGAVAVVVDALRASATLAALLLRGAGRVHVVARVDDARRLAAAAPGALLAGERGGEKLPGFDFGNSPCEIMAAPPLDGRLVVFTSSNGAQRLTACLGAPAVLVGSIVNAAALRHAVLHAGGGTRRPVVLIAAGKYPDETYVSEEDDAVCAYLALRLALPVAAEHRAPLAAAARALVLRSVAAPFRESRHACALVDLGFAADIARCAGADTLPAVPRALGPALLDGRQVGVELAGASPTPVVP